jgi:hypothetical protein
MQHCLITFVSDLRQVFGFLRVLRDPIQINMLVYLQRRHRHLIELDLFTQ